MRWLKRIPYTLAGLSLALLWVGIVYANNRATLSGVVRDPVGAVVADANVSLLSAQQAIISTVRTDAQGRFTFSEVPGGSFLLLIALPGFAERRLPISVHRSDIGNIEATLELQPIAEQVTVTANPGLVEDTGTITQQVNVVGEPAIDERAKTVVAQVANEEVGVHLQRTSPTIAGFFVRGLTGNKVNVYLDGVRYSTAAMRGGISTFLDLIEPSNLQAVEILRGPNSAQYGSDAHGIQTYANKQWGARQNVLVGAEYYHERIHAPSFSFNPVTTLSSPRRPRVPDRSCYHSGGLYAQDVFEAIPHRLRLVGNVRYSVASYRSRTADSPIINGRSLWPNDSLRVSDVTFRAGAVVIPLEGFSLLANVSRGFRAPHITDLGTLGLTGSGFEVAAPDVAGLGGTIGSTADRNAVSTGKPVVQVEPETSLTYEVGARYRHKRFDTDFAFFVNDINDNITKQALILPPGAVGRELGGQPITAQSSNGVVFVAASTSPVLVRANFDRARIYGFEHTSHWKLSSTWSVGTLFTYLHARDKRTGLPPNIEGGTPAPDGYLKVRYISPRRFWIEPYLHAAGRQDRLSSLDLEDRRVGATRSRGNIRDFFLNGATVRGLVSPGPDARLIATGETLAQIQNRVLGAGVESAPLFTAIPGYITFNVRGGLKFGERHEIIIDFENVGDRNYRGISWGLDAPGRSIYTKYNIRF